MMVNARTLRPLLTGALMVGMVNACNPPSDQRGRAPTVTGILALETVMTYGDSTAHDDTAAHGGAMLSRITDAVDDSSGNVFILDSDYKKIAVFGPDGRLKRVIAGGYGSGPGEFKTPIALDLVADELYVYDHGLSRITVFDTLGALRRTIVDLPAPYKDILVDGDTLYATPLPAHEWGLHVIGLSDGSFSEKIELGRNDERFSPDGMALFLGRNQSRQPIVGHMRAGLWYAQSSGDWILHGREVLPGSRAVERVQPAQIYGIGVVESYVAIAYSVMGNESSPEALKSFGVQFDFFTESGDYVATTTSDLGWTSVFEPATDGESFLIAESDPFPRVRRVKLTHAADTTDVEG
jgi:hypothetical protein